MLLKAIRSWIGPMDRDEKVPGVVPQPEFSSVLRRERDRADRTQDVFTLVALGLSPAQRCDDAYGRILGRILQTRLRSTDEAGWLPDGRLGIVLPHTPEDGAWVLVDALRSALQREACTHLLPTFTVYAYESGDGGDGARKGNGEPKRLGRSVSLPQLSQAQSSSTATLRRKALALEPLLLQPPGKAKRVVDVVLASAGLTLTAPLVALSALAIKATSKGPVLFRQQRAGFGGRPFTFYKLRTMIDGAETIKAELADLNEVDGPIFKIARDPRVTWVGRFLRKTSLDELPQLWNVLRGEMSIVGPRPPTLDEVDHYEPWQRRRLHAVGGLTCLWQVSGRSDIGFLDWMRLDLRYLSQRSLGTDLLLILRTIPAVLVGKGAK
jgi:lipopolysaccharide/colanic/teichoic acid biosynthesis glycosyltransferase